MKDGAHSSSKREEIVPGSHDASAGRRVFKEREAGSIAAGAAWAAKKLWGRRRSKG